MMFVVHKLSRSPSDISYNGATWDEADIRHKYKPVYESYPEALNVAYLLTQANPGVGFDVSLMPSIDPCPSLPAYLRLSTVWQAYEEVCNTSPDVAKSIMQERSILSRMVQNFPVECKEMQYNHFVLNVWLGKDEHGN